MVGDKNPDVGSLQFERQGRIQKFITLGELTANISHEIKNILISIGGYCELAKEKKEDKQPFDEELSRIAELSQMAHNIFVQVLRFSRGDEKGEQENSDINEVLAGVFLMVGPLPGIEIKSDFEKELPLLPLDVPKFQQVLLNMIMNAFQAMKGNRGVIKVTTRKLFNDMGVYIEIQDNGCGMSKEVMEQLFTPFFTTKDDGTGLGLSVSKDIINSQNGTIRVESQVGVGTTFQISLLKSKYQAHPDIIDV